MLNENRDYACRWEDGNGCRGRDGELTALRYDPVLDDCRGFTPERDSRERWGDDEEEERQAPGLLFLLKKKEKEAVKKDGYNIYVKWNMPGHLKSCNMLLSLISWHQKEDNKFFFQNTFLT